MWKAMLHVLTGALLFAGCGATTERQCNIDADCASGVCEASGVCLSGEHDALGDLDGGDSVADPDAGADGASDQDGADAPAGDATPTADADPPGDADVCLPNYDGTLERHEIFFTPGLRASFAIARGVTFDTAGSVGEGGARTWDFRPALQGDVTVERGFYSLSDVWFHDPSDEGARYAGATHAIETVGDDDYLSVYEATADALLLRGLASVDDGVYSTELSYDPPLTALSFPFALDDSWESAATVSGWLRGGYSLYWEDATLEVTVDAAGTARTSYASFPVLRVRTKLTRQTGLYPATVRRTYAWVSECFGTIAWVMSQDGEAEVEFNDAAEVGRLVP